MVASEPMTEPIGMGGGQFDTVIEAIPVTLRKAVPVGTSTHPLFVPTLPTFCMQLASDHNVTILVPVHEIAPASHLHVEHARVSLYEP